MIVRVITYDEKSFTIEEFKDIVEVRLIKPYFEDMKPIQIFDNNHDYAISIPELEDVEYAIVEIYDETYKLLKKAKVYYNDKNEIEIEYL